MAERRALARADLRWLVDEGVLDGPVPDHEFERLCERTEARYGDDPETEGPPPPERYVETALLRADRAVRPATDPTDLDVHNLLDQWQRATGVEVQERTVEEAETDGEPTTVTVEVNGERVRREVSADGSGSAALVRDLTATLPGDRRFHDAGDDLLVYCTDREATTVRDCLADDAESVVAAAMADGDLDRGLTHEDPRVRHGVAVAVGHLQRGDAATVEALDRRVRTDDSDAVRAAAAAALLRLAGAESSADGPGDGAGDGVAAGDFPDATAAAGRAVREEVRAEDRRVRGAFLGAFDDDTRRARAVVDSDDERFQRAVARTAAVDDERLRGVALSVASDLSVRVPAEVARRAALGADSPATREAAVERLGRADDRIAATETLIEVLETDDETAVRRAAASALGRQRTESARVALVETLADETEPERVQRAAYGALGAVWGEGDPVPVESVPAYVRERLTDQGTVPPDAAAVAVVGHMDGPGVEDLLVRGLSVEDDMARQFAAQWLSERPTPEAVDELRALLERRAPADEHLTREFAVLALARTDGPEADAALQWVREHPDLEVPTYAEMDANPTVGPVPIGAPLDVLFAVFFLLYMPVHTLIGAIRTTVFERAPLSAARDTVTGVRNTLAVHVLGVLAWALVLGGVYLLVTRLL